MALGAESDEIADVEAKRIIEADERHAMMHFAGHADSAARLAVGAEDVRGIAKEQRPCLHPCGVIAELMTALRMRRTATTADDGLPAGRHTAGATGSSQHRMNP